MNNNSRKKDDKWNLKYELAKNYYNYYGNLAIPVRFKTFDGIEYDENGISLGAWIHVQREAYYGIGTYIITEDKIELLKKIGMNFERNNQMVNWHKKYELAKKYYEHYGNLEVPARFKTNNGFEYDSNGIALGTWVASLRTDKIKSLLTKEKIELLQEIGMRFECTRNAASWNSKYELARKYYEHYGNLEIPTKFKTKDGINYDENGVTLGSWLSAQRQAIQNRGSRVITEEQIKLLQEIGMRFETNKMLDTWLNMYKLAVLYYKKYNNLEVPTKFKTKDGINYDENGAALGAWVAAQRQAIQNRGSRVINAEQIELLKEIKMRLECNLQENNWNYKYELAKKYYEYYGNINISQKFKTKDGINYDENGFALGAWVADQKQAYKGKNHNSLDERRVKLLEELNIVWFSDNINNKLQKEIITEVNSNIKHKEVESRFYSLLCNYNRNGISFDNISKDDIKKINNDFLDSLDTSKKLTLK